MKKMNRKGFTIVELVIVIAVIAILAGVLIPTFSGIVDKANDSKALQEARNIYTNYVALHNYSDGTQPEQSLVIKASDANFVAVKAAQMQATIYDTADKAAKAVGITKKDNPANAAEGFANDYIVVEKATGDKVTITDKELEN